LSKLPQTSTSLLRYLRRQKRVTTRLANATPYALSGTSVVSEGLMKVDERLVAGDPDGSRVELDSAGLRKYAADGTTVQVDLTGDVAAFSGLITGSEIIAGTAGAARVELDSTGLRVYAADGTTVLLDTADDATIRARGDNMALGTEAQQALTSGAGNTAVGTEAQKALTSGANNTAIGSGAQWRLTIGLGDTAVGAGAQQSLTQGVSNAAIGYAAQFSLTTGGNNTAIGRSAQKSLTTGSDNTAIGRSAQDSPLVDVANATTTASYQTSIGPMTGQSSPTQVDGITTVGYKATAGAANATSIGREARADHAGSIALGYQATTTQTNQVMVGPRDVEITDTTKGLVLVSPDTTRMRITVADDGSVLVNGTAIGGGGVGAPTDYTPVLTAATTNPTLGTGGGMAGRYIQVGKLVTYWFNITFGTSGAAAGSGAYTISLPVAARTFGTLSAGGVILRAAGLSTQGHSTLLASTTLRLLYWTAAVNGSLVAVAHNLPGVFTNNDSLRGYITYEAA